MRTQKKRVQERITQKKKNTEVDTIVDAILADDFSVLRELPKNNPTFYLNKCLQRCPTIESLHQIVKTIFGHEQLTNKELCDILPASILARNVNYFTEEDNIITFIEIFYPRGYHFNNKELYTITDLVFDHDDEYENHKQRMLLKLLQYYTAQFRKRLK